MRATPARLRRPGLPVLLLGLGLLVQTVLVITLTRGEWFETDAWHYLTRRGTVAGADLGLWAPYGGHWQSVPILLYRAVFAVVGLRSHLPYLLLSLVVHLVLCVLVHALLRRVGVPAWTALATTWLLLFFGAGAEAFAFDGPFPLTLASAMGFSVLLLLARPEPGRRATVLAAVLLAVAVMTSAAGLVATVAVALFCLLEHGRAVVVRVVGPAWLLFAVWFALLGRSGGRVTVSGSDLLDVPAFAWTGLTTASQSLIGVPGTGGVVLLALIGTSLLVVDAPTRLRHLAWAGILAAATQISLSALASLAFGLDAAQASRYQYVLALYLLPSVALLATVLTAAVRRAVPSASLAVPAGLVLAVLAAVTITGVGGVRTQGEEHAAVATTFKTWSIGVAAAVDDGGVLLTPYPTDSFNREIDLRTVLALRDELPDEQVSAQQVVDAQSQFFVGVRDGVEFGYFGDESVVLGDGFDEPGLVGSGCAPHTATTLTPHLSISGPGGAEIGVTSRATEVTTTLVRDGLIGASRTFEVRPGSIYVATSVGGASIDVSFDAPGRYVVCAGGAPE